MLKDCWTWAADAYASLAPELGSLKSMTQVPTAVKLTTPALIAQPVDVTSRVISTCVTRGRGCVRRIRGATDYALVGALVVGVMTSIDRPGQNEADVVCQCLTGRDGQWDAG